MLSLGLVLLHWLCLAAVDFPYWKFAGLFVLGATFLPFDRIRTVSALNIVFFLITGGILSITSPAVDSEVQFIEAPYLALVSTVLVALIYFALFQLQLRYKFLRQPLLACILCVLLLGSVTLSETVRQNQMVFQFFIAAFAAMIRVFWSACYQLSEIDSLKARPFWEHLGTLAFPWQFGWASPNIVRGFSDLKNEAPRSPEEFRKSQISGMKLMLWALVLQVLADQMSAFVFSRTDTGGEMIVSPLSQWLGVDLSTTGYLEMGIPRYAAWIFVTCTSIHFALSLAATTHAAVSMVRMCGFMVFRHVYRPLHATSFNNFLGRMYYYYIAILLRFFFYPLWRLLRPVRNKNVRIFLTHFLTIFGGGYLTTALRYAPFTVYSRFTELSSIMWGRWPYFLALSTISASSALLPEIAFLGRLRGAWYFLIYTLCFSLQIHYYDTTFQDSLRAFFNLFGL